MHVPAQSLDLEALDEDGSSIAVLNRESRILWVNVAWKRFARENGAVLDESGASAWGPGALYLAGMPAALVDEVAARFERVLRTGEPFVEEYLCSSPDRYREYRMRVLPVERRQLLCEHTLVRVEDAGSAAREPREQEYRTEHGFICMCANCGRTKRLDGQWQWIPSWAAAPPRESSHGLCASCFSYYYGEVG